MNRDIPSKEQVEDIAKMLKAAGWRDTHDGQWDGLKAIIPHLARELSSARETGCEPNPCSACFDAHSQIPSYFGIPDGDIADRVSDLVERLEKTWQERDELKETLAHLARGGRYPVYTNAIGDAGSQYMQRIGGAHEFGFVLLARAVGHPERRRVFIGARAPKSAGQRPRYRGSDCTCGTGLRSEIRRRPLLRPAGGAAVMKLIAWAAVLIVLSWVIVALIVEHETKKQRLDRYKPRPDSRDSRLYWTRTWRT